MLGRLNARTRFQAIAEASIPLSSISLGETSSSSQPVDRGLQPVRIWSSFLIKDAWFLLQAWSWLVGPPEITLSCRCQIRIEFGEIFGNAIGLLGQNFQNFGKMPEDRFQIGIGAAWPKPPVLPSKNSSSKIFNELQLNYGKCIVVAMDNRRELLCNCRWFKSIKK